jgi:hypothetical protein
MSFKDRFVYSILFFPLVSLLARRRQIREMVFEFSGDHDRLHVNKKCYVMDVPVSNIKYSLEGEILKWQSRFFKSWHSGV